MLFKWLKRKKIKKLKKKIIKECLKAGAGACVVSCTGLGIWLLKGGLFGVVGFGPSIGLSVPAIAIYSTTGLAVYGGYKFFQSCKEEPKKQIVKYAVCVAIGCASGIVFCPDFDTTQRNK